MMKKLETNIDGVSEKELLEAQYLAPVSKEWLQKIKIEENTLIPAKLEESIEKAKEMLDQNNTLKALEITEQNSEQLKEKMQKQEEIKQSLEGKLEELKQDAERDLKKAETLAGEEKNQTSKLATLVEKAQKELSRENYLKSILYSSYANALISLSPDLNIPDLPLSLIPLFAIIAVALVIKSKRKKQEKERQEKARKILRKSSEA